MSVETDESERTRTSDSHRRSPMQAWSRRWPLAVLLVVVGVAAGALVGGAQPTTYTAEARVAVGDGDLTTGAIAGFPQAASSLASNYARYVNNRVAAGRAEVAVVASPIPDSNIIRVEGMSHDRAATLVEVDRTASDLVREVNAQRQGDDLLERYDEASGVWARAVTRQQTAQSLVNVLAGREGARASRLAAARAALARASRDVDEAILRKGVLATQYSNRLSSSSAIGLRTVLKAAIVASDHKASVQRYGLLGAVVGLALSLLLAVALERRRSRARRTAR